jgi:hypothetical protein
MTMQQTIQRGMYWGIYTTILVGAMQPGVVWADEEGERERLNLYDRNKRNLRWERERRDNYFNSYNGYGGRSRCCQNGYDNAYRPNGRYRGTIEEPEMAPPE